MRDWRRLPPIRIRNGHVSQPATFIIEISELYSVTLTAAAEDCR